MFNPGGEHHLENLPVVSPPPVVLNIFLVLVVGFGEWNQLWSWIVRRLSGLEHTIH